MFSKIERFGFGLFLVLENFALRIQGTPKRSYVAEVGDIKRLRCAVTGLPLPSITWIKDKQPLKLSERVSKLNNDKTIKINGVRLDDQGKYSCFAENPLGNVYLTFELKVHNDTLVTTESLSASQKPTTEKQIKGEQSYQSYRVLLDETASYGCSF